MRLKLELTSREESLQPPLTSRPRPRPPSHPGSENHLYIALQLHGFCVRSNRSEDRLLVVCVHDLLFILVRHSCRLGH